LKIALFSSKPYDEAYFNKHNPKGLYQITFYETRLNSDTASLTKGYDVACVFVNDVIDEATIAQMHANGIQLIALRCAGFNNVDLKATQRFGIKVVRVPSYAPEAIAEHTVALILTLTRKTHKAYNRVREGNFSLNRLIGFNLHGKTVGVIGTGKIGIALCQILLGFGCQVLAYDLYPSEALKTKGVSYTDLETLYGASDIISLHCPLTEQTKHLINADSISKMKKGVMIINTSRGALIKTEDIIEGLTNEQVGHLGIDVYEQEENLFFQDLSESIIQDDFILRLNSFPNVLITSHQAFFTKEAMDEITTITLQNISAFFEGENLVNEVK